MLIVNDLIRLKEDVYNLKSGSEYSIMDVSNGGIVTFSANSGIGFGMMSWDEFMKYFERIEKPVVHKWSEWIVSEKYPELKYRHNGKTVDAIIDNYRSSSTCHPNDTFNLDSGIEICKQRIEIKVLRSSLARAESDLENFISKL